MRRVFLLTAVVASCGGEEVMPDAAPPPMTFHLGVFSAEPADRPARSQPPLVFIDGIEGRQRDFEYESAMAAVETPHVIELRFDGTTVSQTIAIHPQDFCLIEYPGVVEHSRSYCLYESGDIRFGSSETRSPTGVCVGDGFCLPACGCMPQERCTSRIASTSPFVSHLGCAPAGPRKVGESCTFIAHPEGAYDDCGGGLLCVSGTCRELCTSDSTCTSCSYVEGHAPELRVCLP